MKDPWSLPERRSRVAGTAPIQFNSRGCMSMTKVAGMKAAGMKVAGSTIVGIHRSPKTERVYVRLANGRVMSLG